MIQPIAIDELRQLLGDAEIAELLQAARMQLAADMTQLGALAPDEVVQIRRIAHRVKGMIGALGGAELAQASRELEGRAEQQQVGAADVAAWRHSASATLEALDRQIAALAPAVAATNAPSSPA